MMQRRMLHGVLVLTVFSALAVAGTQEPAPRFTAKTLTGEVFTDDSLKGQVILLQFWTTWCPYCRRDQSIVDNIAVEFSDKGLVVLAVSVGETGQTVKKYVEEHPRSCRIVLTEDTNLVAKFAPKSFPLYVLIDRDGNIAGTQHGAGGEPALRNLLSHGGLNSSPVNAVQSSNQGSSAPKATLPGSPKLIGIPGNQDAPPPKSLPPTVFVLRNGERLEAHHYTIMAGSLRIAADGQQRTIPLNALDLKATIAANHERGIDLKLPTNRSEILLGP